MSRLARPAASRAKRLVTVAGATGLVVVADQVTKSLAVSRLADGPIHLLGPLSLALAYNTGAAFSIGTGLTLPIVLLALFSVGLLSWFARLVPTLPAATGTGMIIGGALGNLADRLFRGHGGAVVDFIHTTFWPTFNLADASIVVGTVILGLALWRSGSTAPPVDARAKDRSVT